MQQHIDNRPALPLSVSSSSIRLEMEEVLEFIQKLKAPPIAGWEEVTIEVKTDLEKYTSHFTAEQLWNVAEPDQKTLLTLV
jgi:hypothetical protein